MPQKPILQEDHSHGANDSSCYFVGPSIYKSKIADRRAVLEHTPTMQVPPGWCGLGSSQTSDANLLPACPQIEVRSRAQAFPSQSSCKQEILALQLRSCLCLPRSFV
mmetsp:Transcript_28583/g.68103  ORF Transcript_28583/g.68103 Transcript_28583/m.68103 type:complete len:107 (+) Transcript_28583:1760-2080(+)